MKDRKVKTGLVWGLVPVGERRIYREVVKEEEYGGNIMYSCMKIEK
jgi:hypothetical protein